VCACVGNGDYGLAAERELSDGMRKLINIRRDALVEQDLRLTVSMLDCDWHVRCAVRVCRIENAHVVACWLGDFESIYRAELPLVLIVVVQIHRADETANGRAFRPF